jgi:hypothetical protein
MNIPGQWEGIRLLPGSSGNRFINSRIRNAVNGIIADSTSSTEDPMLYLSGSRIENHSYAGLIAGNTTVYSYNTVIANCGHYAAILRNSGSYTFFHCTLANYWSLSARRTPSLLIERSGSANAADELNVIFGNSIVHGSAENEVEIRPGDEPSGTKAFFTHSLLKVRDPHKISSSGTFYNCIAGEGPGFENPREFNYRPGEKSPLIDAGDHQIGLLHPADFEGKNRISDKAPDIGAFERNDD